MVEAIRTERLLLREPRVSDAEAVTDLVGDPRIYEKVARIPAGQTLQQTETFLLKTQRGRVLDTDHIYIIEKDGALVGLVSAHRNGAGETFEIGYWLAPAHWGQGYVTEAARALIGWLEEHGRGDELISGYFADNPASGRVLEKLGFTKTHQAPVYCLGRHAHIDHIFMVRRAKAQ
ncbi:GNAT family N-acetyltransferase [Henriciella sp. AS95]|uniref:GNAT family N-acetyltransferase n=1 Tax=Henriciella sp. AS95 TaxID=3135782 RepID=UPI00317EC4D1